MHRDRFHRGEGTQDMRGRQVGSRMREFRKREPRRNGKAYSGSCSSLVAPLDSLRPNLGLNGGD